MIAYFLIPIFNEFENLELLSVNLISSLPDKEKIFVFVDDCSTDKSVDYIHKLFEHTNYKIIEKSENKGPGHSFNLGFEWILIQNSNPDDIIITMEGDNTSDINLLNNMVAISGLGYSLVLASVYAQGGGFEKTFIFRKMISFVANMIFRSLLNTKVLTLSSFYRIYHLSLIKKIKVEYDVIIKENGFICMLEILLKAIYCDAKIIELPMVLKSLNRIGKSKMKIIKNTIGYIKFLPKARSIVKLGLIQK